MLKILKAIEETHNNNTLYRDVEPFNIAQIVKVKTNNAFVRKNKNKTDGTVNGIGSGTVNISLNKNEQAVYSLLEKNPYYTRQELADATSKSLRDDPTDIGFFTKERFNRKNRKR